MRNRIDACSNQNFDDDGPGGAKPRKFCGAYLCHHSSFSRTFLHSRRHSSGTKGPFVCGKTLRSVLCDISSCNSSTTAPRDKSSALACVGFLHRLSIDQDQRLGFSGVFPVSAASGRSRLYIFSRDESAVRRDLIEAMCYNQTWNMFVCTPRFAVLEWQTRLSIVGC